MKNTAFNGDWFVMEVTDGIETAPQIKLHSLDQSILIVSYDHRIKNVSWSLHTVKQNLKILEYMLWLCPHRITLIDCVVSGAVLRVWAEFIILATNSTEAVVNESRAELHI